MIQAHPLHWPVTRQRTPRFERRPAPFSRQVRKTFAAVRDELLNELRLLDATDVVLSSDLKLRRDGLPYSGQAQPDDVGVAIYFTLDGEPLCMTCDRWERIEDNVRALTLSIAALRGLDRWGGGDMVKAAFSGFPALPESAGGVAWWTVLEVAPDADAYTIGRAFHARAKTAHPDRGGNDEAFHALRAAYDQGMAAAKGAGRS